MNFYALNGETLNGSSVPLTAASATVDLYGNLTAAGTRVLQASAQLNSGAAAFSATAKLNGAMVADAGGVVDLGLNPTFTQAAAAAISGAADMRIAVYSIVAAQLNIIATANFQAIPASTLGAANIVGVGGLTASATPIRPGSAAMPGTVNLGMSPTVIRNVAAAFPVTVALRAEAKQNNKLDAYADIAGNVNVTTPNNGIVLRQASAWIDPQQDLGAKATYIHAAARADMVCYADLEPDSVNVAIPAAFFTAGADLGLGATRVVSPSAFMTVAASVNAPAKQLHAPSLAITGSADIITLPLASQLAFATIDPSASIGATSTRVVMAESDIDGGADLTPAALNSTFAAVTVDCLAFVAPRPTRLALVSVDGVLTADFYALANMSYVVTADVQPSASLDLAPTRTTYGAQDIDPTVDVVPGATVKMMASATIDTLGLVSADARLNIEAYDPPERTLYRPLVDTELRRPFTDTEMRRAA